MVGALVSCVLLLAVGKALGYASGDPVPMMMRVQHSGVRCAHNQLVAPTSSAGSLLLQLHVPRLQTRTHWSEVPHRVAPRFGTNRVVEIDLIPPDHPYTEPYKM